MTESENEFETASKFDWLFNVFIGFAGAVTTGGILNRILGASPETVYAGMIAVFVLVMVGIVRHNREEPA